VEQGCSSGFSPSVISDQGLIAGPPDDEPGHVEDCPRHATAIAEWDATWEAEPCLILGVPARTVMSLMGSSSTGNLREGRPLRDLQSHRQALVPGLQAALDPVRWLR
jgi:hypothetical protein